MVGTSNQSVPEMSVLSIVKSTGPQSHLHPQALPVPALRTDLGALLTAGRFLPRFAAAGPWGAAQLTDPFAETVKRWGKWSLGCQGGLLPL
jgi:hypothetical protein